MKKLIIFVSLLFLAMAYGKAEDKEVLKIATFNLRMDTPSDGENAWFPRVWEDKHYLYPIPDLDIIMNPNLTQNPGW